MSFINNIIYTRGSNGCKNGYFERHHIIPKCLGGSNDKSNLIDLYAEEHFHAHKLLAQEYPENGKLVSAYAMMAFIKNEHQKRVELSSKDYLLARETFSQLMKKKWQDENYRNTQSNNLIKRWKNPSYRKSQSERRTELNNKMWSDPDFRKKIGEKTNERWKKLTPEKIEIQKNRMKDLSNKLWSNPDYIRQHCSPVHCLETNEYFFKQQDACTKYNINSTGISNCLKGRQKSAGKHPVTGEKLHWENVSWETYYDDTTSVCENEKISLLGNNEF